MKPLFVCVFALALSATGCALLTKSEPFTPRYFSVEPATDARVTAAGPARAVKTLRLGRVSSASFLGERLVYRKSKRELAYYEDLRWTERPEAYFRRTLVRTLFEQARFGQAVAGAGPILDADLVEFTELRTPAHVARVRATYALYEGRTVLSAGTVTIEAGIAEAKGDAAAAAIVDALSTALDQLVVGIADNVDAALSAGEPSSAESAETP